MIIEGYLSNKKAVRIYIKDGIIKKINPILKPKEELYILAGFIDQHTHGGYGTDFMDATIESTEKYLRNLPCEGTTTILHTSVTNKKDLYYKAIKNFAKYKKNPKTGITKVYGIHSEGIYLAEEKKGAHNSKYFDVLTKKEIDYLQKISNNNIKLLTYAIEKCNVEETKHLVKRNIVPSVGHSNATYDEVIKHTKVGLKSTTHMFNAMTGVHHRDPGIAVAGLLEENLYTELICDGIHVVEPMVKLLYKIKGADKIIVITDSVSPKGMPDGEYSLAGYKIFKKNDKIVNELGAIAGSISSMIENFKRLIKYTNCSLEEAEKMTSTNTAKLMGMKKIGMIKEGYLADLIILDEKYNLKKTIIEGEIAYAN